MPDDVLNRAELYALFMPRSEVDILIAAGGINLTNASVAHREIHEKEKEARDKSEGQMEKRLEGMNQFREQLKDQSGNFMTKEAFEGWRRDNDKRYEEMRGLINNLQGVNRWGEGKERGQGMVIAAIIASVTVAVTILGAIILVANFATQHAA